MKTLYANFENVKYELWKRYIRTLKTLNPNFENVWTNEQKSGPFRVNWNKPGTAHVGAISKAQNYKTGDPLGFVKLQLVAKYGKIEGETLWCNPKISKIVA